MKSAWQRAVLACYYISLAWAAGPQNGLDCLSLTASDLPSKYVNLPNNITMKPLTRDWRLDFTIITETENGKETPLVCVSLEVKGENIRHSLFLGRCEDEKIIDFQLWDRNMVPEGEWTMVKVTMTPEHLNLVTLGSGDTTLMYRDLQFPSTGHLQLSHLQSVEAALSCRVSCPACRGSESLGNKLSTVKELYKPTESFFFRPGSEFARLNFEMSCETNLGHEVLVGDTELTSDMIRDLTPLRQWHKMFLEYDHEAKAFRVIIDYRTASVKQTGLDFCYNFKKMFVRAEGETFVSFTCDPTSGEVVHVDTSADELSCPTSVGSIAIITLAGVVIVLLIIGLGYKERKYMHIKEKYQPKQTKKTPILSNIA